MIDRRVKKSVIGLFLVCLLGMLWLYQKGYGNSIGWEVTTSAEVLEYPAIVVEGQLLDYEVNAEQYLLTENYSGSQIRRNRAVDTLLISLSWLGLCIVLAGASFLKRFGFMAILALFALLINRLNLSEIAFFGIQNRMVLVIPFLGIVAPLFYFHEYRPQTSFILRLLALLLVSFILVFFGANQPAIFLDYFVSHSQFTLALAALLFLFIVAEENVYALLFLITRGTGGKSNHLHFIALSLIYLANLILYYLNKSGYFPNAFSFFDPYLLLCITSVVALWSLQFKASYLSKYMGEDAFLIITLGLGIILSSVLGLAFFRGNDAIYESFHYFILYFHIGFGFFFFLYVLINFIDPLMQGFAVHKITYKEMPFHYISARLAGFVVVLGLYFLASQEPYNLLKSGYYIDLGNLEESLGNNDLADQYYEQASFLGYNTHHSNYQLAWNYAAKGNEYLTKTHFEKAATRYPSPYAYVNYANLDTELNPVKVQALMDQASQQFSDGELRNNQGILRMRNEEWELALHYFENAESSVSWNQAPLLNKWATLTKLNRVDSSTLESDFQKGNLGVRTNILATQNKDVAVTFNIQGFSDAPVLHRHSFLLNAAPRFSEDTLVSLATIELDQSINATYNDRLRKALAIHYYKRGEVNEAFRMLDNLQANASGREKGGYLQDLGKLAFDQGAFQLALDFYQRAANNDQLSAEINQLEVLAMLGRVEEIPDSLLKTVEKDPGLTRLANELLSKLEAFEPGRSRDAQEENLSDLSMEDLEALAKKNAFKVPLIIDAVQILEQNNVPSAYDIVLEASEINPFSVGLKMQYALTALNQNLIQYAEAMLPRIEELVSADEYQTFLATFNQKKTEVANEEWGGF